MQNKSRDSEKEAMLSLSPTRSSSGSFGDWLKSKMGPGKHVPREDPARDMENVVSSQSMRIEGLEYQLRLAQQKLQEADLKIADLKEAQMQRDLKLKPPTHKQMSWIREAENSAIETYRLQSQLAEEVQKLSEVCIENGGIPVPIIQHLDWIKECMDGQTQRLQNHACILSEISALDGVESSQADGLALSMQLSNDPSFKELAHQLDVAKQHIQYFKDREAILLSNHEKAPESKSTQTLTEMTQDGSLLSRNVRRPEGEVVEYSTDLALVNEEDNVSEIKGLMNKLDILREDIQCRFGEAQKGSTVYESNTELFSKHIYHHQGGMISKFESLQQIQALREQLDTIERNAGALKHRIVVERNSLKKRFETADKRNQILESNLEAMRKQMLLIQAQSNRHSSEVNRALNPNEVSVNSYVHERPLSENRHVQGAGVSSTIGNDSSKVHDNYLYEAGIDKSNIEGISDSQSERLILMNQRYFQVSRNLEQMKRGHVEYNCVSKLMLRSIINLVLDGKESVLATMAEMSCREGNSGTDSNLLLLLATRLKLVYFCLSLICTGALVSRTTERDVDIDVLPHHPSSPCVAQDLCLPHSTPKSAKRWLLLWLDLDGKIEFCDFDHYRTAKKHMFRDDQALHYRSRHNYPVFGGYGCHSQSNIYVYDLQDYDEHKSVQQALSLMQVNKRYLSWVGSKFANCKELVSSLRIQCDITEKDASSCKCQLETCQKEIDMLSNREAALKDELQVVEKNVFSTKEDISTKDMTIHRLESQMSSMKEEYHRHSSAMTLKVEEIETLTSEIASTTAQLISTDTMLAKYTEDSSSMRENWTLLKSELEKSRSDLDAQVQGCSFVQEQIAKEKAQYREIDRLLIQATQQLNLRHAEAEAARRNLNAVQSSLDKCKTEIVLVENELETSIPELEQQTQELERKSNEVKELQDQLSDAKEELHDKKKRLNVQKELEEKVNAQLMPLRMQLDSLGADLVEKTMDVKAKQDSVHLAQTQLKEVEAAIHDKSIQIEKYAESLCLLEKHVEDGKDSLKRKTSALQDLESKSASLESEKQQCATSLAAWASQMSKKQLEFDSSTIGLRESQEELQNMQMNSQKLTNDLCGLKADLLVTRQLIEHKEKIVYNLIKELETSSTELDGHKKILEEKSLEIQELQARMTRNTQDLETSKSLCAKQEKTSASLKKDIRLAEEEISTASNEKEKLDKEYRDLLQNLNSSKVHNQELTRQIAEKEKQCEQVQNKLAEVQRAIMDATSQSESKSQEEESIKKKLAEFNAQHQNYQKLLTSKSSNIENLQNTLKKAQVKSEETRSLLHEREKEESQVTRILDSANTKLSCLEKELALTNTRMAQSKDTLEVKQKYLRDIEAKISTESCELEKLSECLQGILSELSMHETSLLSKNLEVQKCSQQLEDAKHQLATKTEQMVQASAKCAAFRVDIDNATTHCQKLKASLDSKTYELAVKEKLLLEKTSMSEEIAKNLDVKQKEMEDLDCKVNTMDKQLVKIQHSLSETTCKVGELMSSYVQKQASLERYRSELDTTNARQTELQDEESSISSDLASLKSSLHTVTSSTEEMVSKLTTAKADLMVTKQLCHRKTEFLASLKEELKTTSDDVSKYQQLLDEKSAETDLAEQRLGDLKQNLMGVKEKVLQSENTLEPLKNRVDVCTKEVAEAVCMEESLADQIKNQEQQLGECQTSFAKLKTSNQELQDQLLLKEKELMNIRQLLQGMEEQKRAITHKMACISASVTREKKLVSTNSESLKGLNKRVGKVHKQETVDQAEFACKQTDASLYKNTNSMELEAAGDQRKKQLLTCKRLSQSMNDLDQDLKDIDHRGIKYSNRDELDNPEQVKSTNVHKKGIEDSEIHEQNKKCSSKEINQILTDVAYLQDKNKIERDRSAAVESSGQESDCQNQTCMTTMPCTLGQTPDKNPVDVYNEINNLKAIQGDKKKYACRAAVEVNSLKTLLDEEKRKAKKREDKINQLLHKKKVLEDTLVHHKKSVEKMDCDINNYRKEAQVVENELEGVQQKIKQKTEQINEKNTQVINAKESTSENRALLGRLEDKYHHLCQELENRKQEHDRVLKNIRDQQGVCKEQESKLKILMQEIRDMETLGLERSSLQTQNTAAIKTLEEQKQDLNYSLLRQSEKALALAKEAEVKSKEVFSLRDALNTKIEVCAAFRKQIDKFCEDSLGGVLSIDESITLREQYEVESSDLCKNLQERHARDSGASGTLAKDKSEADFNGISASEGDSPANGKMSAREMYGFQAPEQKPASILCKQTNNCFSYTSTSDTEGDKTNQSFRASRNAPKWLSVKPSKDQEDLSCMTKAACLGIGPQDCTDFQPSSSASQRAMAIAELHGQQKALARQLTTPQTTLCGVYSMKHPAIHASAVHDHDKPRADLETPDQTSRTARAESSSMAQLDNEKEKACSRNDERVQSTSGRANDVASSPKNITRLQKTLKHTIEEMDKLHDAVQLMCTSQSEGMPTHRSMLRSPSVQSVDALFPSHSGKDQARQESLQLPERKLSLSQKKECQQVSHNENPLNTLHYDQHLTKLESKLRGLVQSSAAKDRVIRDLRQQLNCQHLSSRMIWR